MSHTPGPWMRLPSFDDETGEPDGRLELRIVGPEYVQRYGNEDIPGIRDTVCVLGFSSHDAHEANARLIAAAPELLEALKGVESTYVFLDSMTSGIEPQHANTVKALARVRAAIAKATGGDK